jgi:hypothetical protein
VVGDAEAQGSEAGGLNVDVQFFNTAIGGGLVMLLGALVRHIVKDIETRKEVEALKQRLQRIERHLNGALK